MSCGHALQPLSYDSPFISHCKQLSEPIFEIPMTIFAESFGFSEVNLSNMYSVINTILIRNKICKREILRDYQLKIESNFMLDFSEELYPSDIYHELDDLFTIKTEVDKFLNTIEGISARLRQ